MASKRILELAKELHVDISDLQGIALHCGVAISGPTSILDDEDIKKIRDAVKSGKDVSSSSGSKSGSKTLTLNRPMVAGQPRAGGSDGRGRTVTVEVRRRRHASSSGKPEQVTSKKAVAAAAGKPTLKRVENVAPPQVRAQTATTANKTPNSNSSGAREQSTGNRREGRSIPRTTFRKQLTPAQIAATKAPRSSLKQIEASIKSEASERRRKPAATARPERASTPGTPRRTPSVAVAPQPGGAAPGAQRGRPRPGSQGRFQQRRLTPAQKAARRTYEEKRHVVLTEEEEERMARLAKGGAKRRKGIDKDDADFVQREVEITENILVSELASRMAVKGAEVVKKLFNMGLTITINELIDAETAEIIVQEFGHKPKLINEAAVEDQLIEAPNEDDAQLEPRPPVVVVMGHVDHGKTSILDAIRKANVADGEAGGITQHIGAYMVRAEDGSRVVFVDTPGHEAFTSLRARGARLTDVAVLVVAADDGVKPQTVEALNHARAANVPIIVAINKMDKEDADPEMVKRQLSEHELIAEDWGGDAIFVPVSAQTGEGLDELLEMLALQTEILELKANPDRSGRGVVIESRLDKGRGPVATVLVQNGTFNKGDIVVTGTVMGHIRAIVDENSVQHRTAGPSIPFELLGLESVPEAGQEIAVVESERQARSIVSYRKDKVRKQGAQVQQRASLEELFAQSHEEGAKELPVLIKGDVTGSVEAMADSLTRAGTDDVHVKVVHKAIGGINESDIMLASASHAIVIGFNVRPEVKAKKRAVAEGVDVRFYKVIYDAIDDIKVAMAGQLSPDQVEKVIGSADVREIFQVPRAGMVAGCYVTDGFVTRDSSVRVLRESVLIYDGKLASLRRFKEDVKEVKSSYECGIGIEKFNDVKAGDTLEFYVIEEVAATL